jgi:hypothetical protein
MDAVYFIHNLKTCDALEAGTHKKSDAILAQLII